MSKVSNDTPTRKTSANSRIRSIKVGRDAKTGRFVVRDRISAAVRDAKERYSETLRRLK